MRVSSEKRSLGVWCIQKDWEGNGWESEISGSYLAIILLCNLYKSWIEPYSLLNTVGKPNHGVCIPVQTIAEDLDLVMKWKPVRRLIGIIFQESRSVYKQTDTAL